MSSAKTLSVHVKANPGGGKLVGVGTLEFQRPARMRFDMTADGSGYVYAANEKGGIELDQGANIYSDFTEPGRLARIESSVSEIPDFGLPSALFDKDLHHLAPPKTAFNLTGKAVDAGVPVDVVDARYSGSMGSGEIVLHIDAKGHLVRLNIFRQTMDGTIDLRYDLTNYIINGPIPPSRFNVGIPIGYVPWSLPSSPSPIASEESVPLGKWLSTDGSRPVDLAALGKGKVVLMVAADPASEPSSRILDALSPAAKRLKAAGGVYAVISAAPDRAGATALGFSGTLFDPTTASLKALHLPGTPLVYLVGRNGNLIQAWFGFDADAKRAFNTDLDAALAKAGIK